MKLLPLKVPLFTIAHQLTVAIVNKYCIKHICEHEQMELRIKNHEKKLKRGMIWIHVTPRVRGF